MNIVLDKQPKCTATLNVEVPAASVIAKRDKISSSYLSQAKIPGFRPGKAPRSVIEKRFGKQISEELSEALFEEACQLALEKEELKVLDFGVPNQFDEREDGSIAFTTQLILAPEFTLPEYKGIAVSIPDEAVTDEELDGQLQKLRERFADFQDVTDRAVQADDIAVVDFTTTLADQPLVDAIGEKGKYLSSRENHWLPVKDGAFLPGYATQLVGMAVDEQKNVTITLPEDFPMEELQGKEIVLNTTLRGIKSMTLPELDNDFVEKILPGKTLEDLINLLRESLGEEKRKNIGEMKVDQVIEFLIQEINFELPEEVLHRETQNQINMLVQEGSKQGASDQDLQERQEEIFSAANERAVNNLRTNFILQEIALAEKITVSDQQLLTHIQRMATARKQPLKKVIKELQASRSIQSIRNSLLIGLTIDFLVNNASVSVIEKIEESSEENA